MLSKSRIIVLHTIKHSDSGMVVQCYSNTAGRTSCYFFARGKHSKNTMMFPLSMLDVVLHSKHQGGTSMPLIKEASQILPLQNLKTDIRKGAIAMFMCELLLKTVRESSPEPAMFSFLSNSIMLLDAMDEGVENFHLHFAVNLCKVLGYMPEDNYSPAHCPGSLSGSAEADSPSSSACPDSLSVFAEAGSHSSSVCPGSPSGSAREMASDTNLKSRTHFNFTTGTFVHDYSEVFCFLPEESFLLHQILSTPLTGLQNINCSGQVRNRFLGKIIDYLSFHTSLKTELKSLAVLRELFAE